MSIVPNQSYNHTVEVEEEHHKVEAKLEKRFLAMSIIPLGQHGCVSTFLWTFNFLKISVASRRCWLSKILGAVREYPIDLAYTNFLPFHPKRGKLRMNATQYPLIRKRRVRKACTAASGMMYVLSRLQRSIGLI